MKKLLLALVTILSTICSIQLQAQDSDLFDRYTWLSVFADPTDCTTEKVEEYESFLYEYLLITFADGQEALYNAQGTFYCRNASNYDCVAAYRLDGPTASWTCENTSNTEEEALISRLQNSGTNCYDIVSISKIEYEGNNYYLPQAGNSLRHLLAQGPAPCGVLESFPSLYDSKGRRVCDFGFTALPCPIARRQGTIVWTNEEASCTIDDPFSIDIIQRSIKEDRFILQGSDTCKNVQEIIQFDYRGFTFFRINEASYSSSCSSVVASRFYSCDGAFVGGVGNAPTCQNPIVCEGLDLSSRSGEMIWVFEENEPPASGGVTEIDNAAFPWLSNLINPTTCTTEKIAVYQSGIYKYVLVTDATGAATLYNEQGQFYCENRSNFDCVSLYNLGAPIDTWECQEESNSTSSEQCNLTITSGNCRPIGIYDVNNNLLHTLDPGRVAFPGFPDGRPFETWTDTRPLMTGEARIYIFKINNLVIGQQAISCENTDIEVVYEYGFDTDFEVTLNDFLGCTDVIDVSDLTNTGCRDLQVINSSGSIQHIIAPNESLFFTEGGGIYILLAGMDTLGISDSGFSKADINTGGCDNNGTNCICPEVYDPVCGIDGNFYNNSCEADCAGVAYSGPCYSCNTAGLLDFIDCAPTLKEVAIYRYQEMNYVVYFPRENSTTELYAHTCSSFDRFCEGAACTSLVAEGQLLEVIYSTEGCPDDTSTEPICGNYTGTIFFENCDDGVLYFFVRLDDGRVFDPYFDAGITYNPIDGQRIRFDFVEAAFSSPCSRAEKAITVTCIENIEGSTPENEIPEGGENNVAIFTDFPWLSSLVNPTTCNGEMITVYQIGSFQYVYIASASGSNFYFQDGTFYCTDLPNYDCRMVYGVSRIVATWRCANFDMPANESRNKQQLVTTDIVVYPNPTIGQLTIEMPILQQQQQLQITDLLGRTVYTEKIAPATSFWTIDLSDYENGIYYVQLHSRGLQLIKKIVKQGLE